MHMADALLSPPVAGAMAVLSAGAAAAALREYRREDGNGSLTPGRRLPEMAIMSALVFAGQMINYTIPGTGSSGHIGGGFLLAAILGPSAGFLSMIAVLTIQCLFFADGGLMALGANIWNMGFYGCFAGYYLIYRPLMRRRFPDGLKPEEAVHRVRRRLMAASVLGCVVSLQLGAFSVVLETSLSGITALPFGAFAALMQPIHLAIGLVEGVITGTVLGFLYSARPELIREDPLACREPGQAQGKTQGQAQVQGQQARHSRRAVLAVLLTSALVIGGGLSLVASSAPDGLEWSLFGSEERDNMALDEDDFGIDSAAADRAAALQEKTALMPDYAFASDPDNPLGTTAAGLLGVLLAAAAVTGIGTLVRRRHRV